MKNWKKRLINWLDTDKEFVEKSSLTPVSAPEPKPPYKPDRIISELWVRDKGKQQDIVFKSDYEFGMTWEIDLNNKLLKVRQIRSFTPEGNSLWDNIALLHTDDFCIIKTVREIYKENNFPGATKF